MYDETDYQYFNISKHKRDSTIGFLLESLLHARCSCGLTSNEKIYDEDVNIYLAHLLFANSFPDYIQLVGRYLTLNSSDMIEMIEQSNDKVYHYFVYKVNADYLLVHLGIFHDMTALAKKPFHKSEQQFIEMAQNYYEQASVYSQQIYRKKTAISDVLIKLAQHFGDYKHILEKMREDFFRVTDSIRAQSQMISIGDDLDRVALMKRKQDEFLDVYGEWLRTKSEDLIGTLIHLTEELKELDPKFNFDINSINHPGQ